MAIKVCDPCFEAGVEETSTDEDEDVVLEFLQEMGADIADHVCDHVDEPEIECQCTCNK